MSERHTFCRVLLSYTMNSIRKYTTAEERRTARASKSSTNDNEPAEFHGPGKFYWSGCAHCKWEAEAKGWVAWLDKND